MLLQSSYGYILRRRYHQRSYPEIRTAEVHFNPSRIITDRGTAFTSTEFKDYCRKENIASQDYGWFIQGQ